MDVNIPLYGRNGRYGTFGAVKKYAVVDEADAAFVRQWRWSLYKTCGIEYAARRRDGVRFFMHRELLGLGRGGGQQVDHINRDGLDNRRSNLRLITNAQQQQNRGPTMKNATGFRGVYRNKSARNSWVAKVVLGGKVNYLGSFSSPEQAASAASTWRKANMPFAVD